MDLLEEKSVPFQVSWFDSPTAVDGGLGLIFLLGALLRRSWQCI